MQEARLRNGYLTGGLGGELGVGLPLEGGVELMSFHCVRRGKCQIRNHYAGSVAMVFATRTRVALFLSCIAPTFALSAAEEGLGGASETRRDGALEPQAVVRPATAESGAMGAAGTAAPAEVNGPEATRSNDDEGAFLGRLVDAQTFLPVAGARVWFKALSGEILVEALANHEGDFTLPVGEMLARLEKGEGADAEDPSAAERRQREAILLEVDAPGFYPPRHEESRRFKLEDLRTPGERVGFLLEPVLKMQGLVVDSDGKPVAGARVAWGWQVISDLHTYRGGEPSVESDEQGRFTWQAPYSACRSVLVAVHPDHVLGWLSIVQPQKKAALPLMVKMQKKGTLRGTILSPSGQGVQGVRVTLVLRDAPRHWFFLSGEPVRSLHGGASPWERETGNDGTFVFDRLPLGRYGIRLSHPELASPPDLETTIEVTQDSSWKATLVTGRCVKGIVVDQEGKAVGECRVRFETKEEGIWVGILGDDRFDVGWLPAVSRVGYDNQGGFCAPNLPWRPLRVQAVAAGSQSARIELQPEQSDFKLVLLRPETAKKRPSGMADVRFKFLWEGCVADVEHATVSVYAPGSRTRVKGAVVDVRRGHGSVIGGLPMGTYDMVVAAYGCRPCILREVSLPIREPIELAVVPTVPLKMRIVSECVVDRVRIFDQDGHQLRACVGHDNEFSVRGLEPGTYDVRGVGSNTEAFASSAPVQLSTTETAIVNLVRTQGEQDAQGP